MDLVSPFLGLAFSAHIVILISRFTSTFIHFYLVCSFGKTISRGASRRQRQCMCAAGGSPLPHLSQRKGPSLPKGPTQLSELSGLKPRPGWPWRATRQTLPPLGYLLLQHRKQMPKLSYGSPCVHSCPQNIQLQSYPHSLQQWPWQSQSGDIKTSQWVELPGWKVLSVDSWFVPQQSEQSHYSQVFFVDRFSHSLTAP